MNYKGYEILAAYNQTTVWTLNDDGEVEEVAEDSADSYLSHYEIWDKDNSFQEPDGEALQSIEEAKAQTDKWEANNFIDSHIIIGGIA